MAVQNVQIKPQYVYLGKDQVQIQSITCVADVASSLSAKYFLFHDAAGAKRYAWFNTGASVDPAPAGGWTGHVVAISSGASASAVATALAAVLTAVAGFDATASGYVVTLTHTATGYAQPARDVNTNFAFSVTQLGMVETSAGCIQGSLEMSNLTVEKVEITCHASGTTVKDERISGYGNPEMTMTFQETDKESLKKLFIMLGMPTLTPVGVDKDEIFGYGMSNLGGSNPKIPIRMHAVSKDASDKSEDINIWFAELSIDSLNWSGEEVSTVPATFKLYPDDNKPKGIQFFMIGDAAKAGY